MKVEDAGRRDIRTRAPRQVAQGVDRAVEHQLAKGWPADDLAQTQGAKQVAGVVAHFAPVSGTGDLQNQAQPVDPLGREPASRTSPDVGAAQKQIEVASKEHLRSLDIARPVAQELDILPVMTLLQRFEVEPAQVFTRKILAGCANAASSLRN